MIYRGLDAMRGIGVQLLGECGPSIVVLFLFGVCGPMEAERSKAKPAPAPAPVPAPAPAVEVIPQIPNCSPEERDGTDPQIQAFLLRNTTRVTGERLKPERLFRAWSDHCTALSIQPGTQPEFSRRVAKFVNRELTKRNRNVWIGIALKDRAEAPKLHVVPNADDSLR